MESLARCNNHLKVCHSNTLLKVYYLIRPSIPRRLQIMARRRLSGSVKKRSTSSWPISHTASERPSFWKGWRDNRQFALILTHDVEKQGGYRRHRKLMEIEKEMGFVSSFNFVPERYSINENDLVYLKEQGFEVGVHGLYHDGKLLQSEKIFLQRAQKINQYIRKWGATGFRAPSMHHNLELFKYLDIEYDLSTFDTDPFEPQSDGVNTIFPFYVPNESKTICYWELPYTLPQDNTLFIILREKSTEIWKEKADWIAEHGGMVLLNTHPDYIDFGDRPRGFEQYPISLYADFLNYMKEKYAGRYWNPLPGEMVRYFNEIYRDLN